MNVGNAIGFGIVFLALIAMTDVPATQQIGAGFAILIALSVALLYGPQAAQNIITINGPTTGAPGGGMAVPKVL